MISKELLSEVLGAEVEFAPTCLELANGSKCIEWKKVTKAESHTAVGFQGINIYELAHKCKEWAGRKGFSLLSSKESCQAIPSDRQCHSDYVEFEVDIFEMDSNGKVEIDFIFEVCQWILEKQKGLK